MEKSVTSTQTSVERKPVLNMIRFPDRDTTGFCNSEQEPHRTGFRKKLNRIRYGYPNCIDHCNKMLDQKFFSDINRIGSNIWTGLPDYGLDRITQ